MTFDFDGIKTELQDRLRLLSDWANTLFLGIYDRITDLVAYIMEKAVYLAEFYYREALLTTAQKIESVSPWIRLLNYSAHRKQGAEGYLSVSGDSTFSVVYKWQGQDVSIPRWTRFSDADNILKFYATEDNVYYRNTIGNFQIDIKQGTPKEYEYIAKGDSNEVAYLYSDSVDNTQIYVYIVDADGNILSEVEQVENIYITYDLVNYKCQIKNSDDFKYLIITFGDNYISRGLSNGTRILFKYADTDGADNDVSSINTIIKIVDTIYDSTGAEATLYCTNAEELSGSTDIESIDSIKINAPLIMQTGVKCDNQANWKTIVESIPFIYKASIWTVEDLGGSSLIDEQNSVYISAITTSGDDITPTQQTIAENTYLKPKKTVTEKIVWYDSQKLYARFDIVGKLYSNATTDITTVIQTTLNDTYGILVSEFQENIYESDYIKVISENSDIVYHNTEMYNYEKYVSASMTGTIVPSYTSVQTSDLEDQIYLNEDSFQIWLEVKTSGSWANPIQIAYSSGATIYSYNPTYTIAGNLIFSTNTYTYTISGGYVSNPSYILNPTDNTYNGYVVSLHYKTKDGYGNRTNDLRLPYRWQIRDIDMDYINTTFTYI